MKNGFLVHWKKLKESRLNHGKFAGFGIAFTAEERRDVEYKLEGDNLREFLRKSGGIFRRISTGSDEELGQVIFYKSSMINTEWDEAAECTMIDIPQSVLDGFDEIVKLLEVPKKKPAWIICCNWF